MEDKLTEVQLAALRRKLSTMSFTAVMDAYRSAYFQCKLEGDQVPSARAIQTLVRVWTELRECPTASIYDNPVFSSTTQQSARSPYAVRRAR